MDCGRGLRKLRITQYLSGDLANCGNYGCRTAVRVPQVRIRVDASPERGPRVCCPPMESVKTAPAGEVAAFEAGLW